VAATEAAAIACYQAIGRGNEKQADQLAVDAMRKSLNQSPFDGRIVIGEGERDQAPMLFIGEEVGTKTGPKIDIALDPLEGTTICAHGMPNSLSVIAFAPHGGFLHAPDLYMEKIAVGGGLPEGIIDLDNTILQNLKNLAMAKKCAISDLMVIILDRPRHLEMISKTREAGARIQLIGDGDVAGVIATAMPKCRADLYLGIGGAPEGVLAAAALRTIGGQMMTRLIYASETDRSRAKDMGVTNLTRKYLLEDMAQGDIIFAATGVTDGFLAKGVKYCHNFIHTHSLIMNSADRTIRKIKTKHLS
jgi:fructose-1,6-bisphosphatase II / sedoheptulose-1,7-bisphosphatase